MIEHKLYWAAASSMEEAQYLSAILNSATLTARVEPLQSRGAFGPRDFDLYVFHVPIPLFDPADLRTLSSPSWEARAEIRLQRRPGWQLGFQKARRLVREGLEATGVSGAIESAVDELLAPVAAP